jgi:asparagine synthase (glutamine-hydrolysing)
VSFDDVGSLVDRDEMLEYFDQPPHNTMHFARWERTKRAQEEGVGVILGGANGDSAISYGLGMLPALLRSGRWYHLQKELRALSDKIAETPRELFLQKALYPLVPDAIKHRYRQYKGIPVAEEQENGTLDPTFVDQIGLRSRYKRLYAGQSILDYSSRRQQYNSLMLGMLTATFETTDLTNAVFGIEPRHPFTDKRLIEFSLAIPPSQQLSDGWTRSIIRRAIDDLLPEKVARRPWKTPVDEAFWNALAREDEELQAFLENPGQVATYHDMAALRSAYERFQEQPNTRDARALWRALSLWTWLYSDNSAVSVSDN